MRDFSVFDEDGEVVDFGHLDFVRQDLLGFLVREDYRYVAGSFSGITMEAEVSDVARVTVVLGSANSSRVGLHYNAGTIYQHSSVDCSDQSALRDAISALIERGNQDLRKQLQASLDRL